MLKFPNNQNPTSNQLEGAPNIAPPSPKIPAPPPIANEWSRRCHAQSETPDSMRAKTLSRSTRNYVKDWIRVFQENSETPPSRPKLLERTPLSRNPQEIAATETPNSTPVFTYTHTPCLTIHRRKTRGRNSSFSVIG